MSYTLDQLRENHKLAELKLTILDHFTANGYVTTLERIVDADDVTIFAYYVCSYIAGEEPDTIAETKPTRTQEFAEYGEASAYFIRTRREEIPTPDFIKTYIRGVISEMTYLRDFYARKADDCMSIAETQTWARNIAVLENLCK